MLRFIKEHLQTIDGIQIFPLISLLIFTIFFVSLFLWVAFMKKEYLDVVKKIPLNENKKLQKR